MEELIPELNNIQKILEDLESDILPLANEIESDKFINIVDKLDMIMEKVNNLKYE